MSLNAKANEPVLQQYDNWGRRVDVIHTSEGWRQLHDVSAEEGVVAIGYERKFGQYSRIYQFCKLFMFNPSSAIYTCPLAMTDGAARLLELYGSEQHKKTVLPRLISRDPRQFWTSGQWMTERTGGSDVGRSETVARQTADNKFRLFGFKWFTSATDANMSLALARVVDQQGASTAGSAGLSVFLVRMRDADDKLNGMTVCRLKEKLGTRAMPTAELELNGAVAELIGKPGRGVATISTILNVTRLYNSICAVSCMRRALLLAKDYSTRRVAFGATLDKQPLHVRTLAWLEVETRASTLLVFHAVAILGREECGRSNAQEADLLRLLTPIAKLFTAKRAIAIASEALECMGGAGYIEDNPFACLLRDAQVMSIWEGTTNVLSLDVLRVLAKGTAYNVYVASVSDLLSGTKVAALKEAVESIQKALVELTQHVSALAKSSKRDFSEGTARHFAFSLARTFAAALLVKFACTSGQEDDVVTARRWVAYGLVQIAPTDARDDALLVYARL
eukprot:TRINITY_DN2587_c0_g1_i1.p1 TRINITY_DN2587_c0_g1~~TRINITY_DN2587_c0_g1_i1.p1  ORF type:complete len:596 (+),score=108.96 TRINITY_DN2587_c0_g1_i1:270-1790(+)